MADNMLVVPVRLWAIENAITAGELTAGFNAIYILDLVLPAFLIGAIKLWRGEGGPKDLQKPVDVVYINH